MEKFKFLEHTADVFIEDYGKTLEEAYQNTAIGLGHLYVESENVESKIEKKIEVESEDEKALLFDFLNNFITFHDADNLIFHEVKVEKIEEKDGNFHLTATTKGEEYNSEKHEQGTVAKAVTYHEMEIKKEKDKYIIKVLIDI